MSVRASFVSMVILLVAITASAQLNSSRLEAQASTNIVSGNVSSSDGQAVADAHVEVVNELGSSLGQAYTNAAGHFTINGLPNGSYEIVATKGVNETRDRLYVAGLDTSVNIHMPFRQAAEDGSATVSVAQMKVPDKAKKLLDKADAAMRKDKFKESRELVDKALAISPEYARALTLRGILEMNDGAKEAAMADFDHSIKADANYAMAYMAMGAAMNDMGKYVEAARTLMRATVLDPTAWQAYFELAKSSLGQANYKDALNYVTKASQISQEYAPIHLVKAHALLGLKMYQEAITELEVYLVREPSGPGSDAARKALTGAKAFVATNQSATEAGAR